MSSTFGKFWRLGASVGVFGAFALAGCNAILGNEEGTPRAAAQGDSGTTPSGTVDGGTGGSSVDGGLITTKECDPGERRCFGLCKRTDDPSVGCSSDSCTACDPKNVQGAPSCTGSSAGYGCDYAACDPAFLDCDGTRSNGCETSKNNKDNCGTCGNKCQMGTPLCANSNGTFACAASCPMGTTQCDNACVDLTQDASNCGGCGVACKKANATAKCASSACAYTCNPGTKECGGACVAVADPKFCLNCSPCPVYANTIATCKDGSRCAYECMPGFYDCDGKPSTGCESNKACTGIDLCGGLLCPVGQKCCGLSCVPENTVCAPAQL